MSVISVLIVSYVKALVGASNQEKALVGAFSVIVVKTGCGTDGSICGTMQDASNYWAEAGLVAAIIYKLQDSLPRGSH